MPTLMLRCRANHSHAVLASRYTAPLLFASQMCAHASAMRVLALLAFAPIAVPQMVSGQTDEIQVYDGRLAAKGRFNLTLHNNFIPEGLRTPAFAGALLADRSLNGVPEWAYGVSSWFEAGPYLPLYNIGQTTAHRRVVVNGVKLPRVFAVARSGGRNFFYR